VETQITTVRVYKSTIWIHITIVWTHLTTAYIQKTKKLNLKPIFLRGSALN